MTFRGSLWQLMTQMAFTFNLMSCMSKVPTRSTALIKTPAVVMSKAKEHAHTVGGKEEGDIRIF